MKDKRWDSVWLEPTGAIPVLVASEDEAEGTLLPTKRCQLVRVLDRSALDLFVNNRRAFEHRYGSVPQQASSRLVGLMLLARALRNHDSKAWDLALQQLASDPWPYLREMERRVIQHQPGLELGRLFAEGLQGIELVLWWDTRDEEYSTILPGFYCPDVSTALYMLAWLHYVESGKGLGICLNCGKSFKPQRSTRRFCSDRCRYEYFVKHPKPKKSRRKRGG